MFKKRKPGTYQKAVFLLLVVLLSSGMLTGCKASKKKVQQSSYYKELLEEKKALEKENKVLEKKVEEAENETKADKRSSKFLKKMSRESIIKMVIGYTDDFDASIRVDEKGALAFASYVASRADKTSLYTAEELRARYSSRYEYIFYDEDNAIYEMEVFGSGYVIFLDLPDDVYYVENITALADAYLEYRGGYPEAGMLHKMADSSLITTGRGRYYSHQTAAGAVAYVSGMEKEKSSRDQAEQTWKENYEKKHGTTSGAVTAYIPDSSEYTFHNYGDEIKMTVYDTYLCLENTDGKRTWYQTTSGNIKELKQIFKDAWETQQKETSSDEESETESTTTESKKHDVSIDEDDTESTEYDFSK